MTKRKVQTRSSVSRCILKFLPLTHCAYKMFLRGVDPHLHQAAAKAAGV